MYAVLYSCIYLGIYILIFVGISSIELNDFGEWGSCYTKRSTPLILSSKVELVDYRKNLVAIFKYSKLI